MRTSGIVVVAMLACAFACADDGAQVEDAVPEAKKPPVVKKDVRAEEDLADLGPGTETTAPADLGEQVAPSDAPANTAPAFAPLNVMTLKMGHAATLDVNPFIEDFQDEDPALVLSWGSQHVAVQDDGTHVLLVVAPTDWFGTESILFTVTDTGGLEGSSELKVIVSEVEVVEPPPEECGKVPFSLVAPEAKEVLLSGSFNDWGGDAASAAVMTDDEKDGTWETTLALDPGTYQYKFIVDGTWIADPANPNKVGDGFDGYNSVVIVPECKP
jgi:hypothetical protein